MKEFTEIFAALAVVGSPLEEEDKVITVLASLPDKFSTVVTALETLEKVPSLLSVTEKLIHEEGKMKLPSDENENQSLVSKEKKIKCYECGKIGHIKRNCYVFKRKLQQASNNSNLVVNESSEHESCENISVFASVSALSANDERGGSWIIDRGCTNHMCNDSKWHMLL